MRNYIFLLLILTGITSCEESELTIFSEPDAIYFQLEKTDFSSSYTRWGDWIQYRGDSITFTFGGVPKYTDAYKEKDTLWLQVNVLGRNTPYDRPFKVVVNNSMTTAEEGVHYEALKSEYKFPNDTVRTSFPVIIYNDESLGETPYTLYLELEENDNFILGLEGRTNARIKIYNDVVKPAIWDQRLYVHLGPYSKAKHRVVLLTNGGRVLPNTIEEYNAMGGYSAIWRMRAPMNAYLKANEVYDENGVRVAPW